jgi:cytoskeleton protein RodZ
VTDENSFDAFQDQPGRKLRAAREAQGWEVAKVAADLLVPTAIVEAMESNRFEAFDAPVYAKGFLRKYAALLGLDGVSIVADYDAGAAGRPADPSHVPVTPAAPRVRFRTSRRIRLPSLRSIGMLVAFVVVLAGGYWYSCYRSAAVRSARPAAVPSVKQDAPTGNAERASVPAQASDSIPIAIPMDASGEASSRLPATGAHALTADSVTIRGIRESWVEVRGADGSRVFYEHVRAGEMYTAHGAGPWRIYLSDAGGVELSLGAHIVDVPASRQNGSEARFGLRPDGTIL